MRIKFLAFLVISASVMGLILPIVLGSGSNRFDLNQSEESKVTGDPSPSMSFETVSENSLAQNPQPWNFRAFGTEPFWGVNVAPSGIVYSSLGGTDVQFPYVQPLHAAGRPEEKVLVFNLGDNNHLTLTRGRCSDGMSDNVYPYIAIFVLGNNVYDGCATPKHP